MCVCVLLVVSMGSQKETLRCCFLGKDTPKWVSCGFPFNRPPKRGVKIGHVHHAKLRPTEETSTAHICPLKSHPGKHPTLSIRRDPPQKDQEMP